MKKISISIGSLFFRMAFGRRWKIHLLQHETVLFTMRKIVSDRDVINEHKKYFVKEVEDLKFELVKELAEHVGIKITEKETRFAQEIEASIMVVKK